MTGWTSGNEQPPPGSWPPPPPTGALPPGNPWGPTQPQGFGPPQPPQQGSKQTGLILTVIAVITVAIVAAVVILANVASPKTNAGLTPLPGMPAVTAATSITATSGTSVFSDDFSSPATGWIDGRSGHAVYAFGNPGLRITGTGDYHFFASSPYTLRLLQVEQTVTATVDKGSAPSGGFGVLCARDIGQTRELHYEFLLTGQGRWFIERRDGRPSSGGIPGILRQGAGTPAGTRPVTLTAVCAGLADQVTTRLMLFVNGVQMADLTDVSTTSTDGWLGEVLSSSDTGEVTVVRVSHYATSRLS